MGTRLPIERCVKFWEKGLSSGYLCFFREREREIASTTAIQLFSIANVKRFSVKHHFCKWLNNKSIPLRGTAI